LRFLKQSTSVDLPIGPFLDETDGKTAETGLTITQPDVRLKKNAGNWAQKAAAQTLSHEENGFYEVTLDATDTDTLGQLRLAVHESGALPVWEEFMVMPANVWDSLFGADALQVHAVEIANALITAASIASDAITDAKVASDVTIASVTGAVGSVTAMVTANVIQISGDATAADNLESYTDGTTPQPVNVTQLSGDATAADNAEAFFDGTGYAGTGNVIPSVTTVTGNVNGNVGGNVTGSVGSVASGGITATSIAADAIGASELAADAVAEIADAVWDEVASGHVAVGSFGQRLFGLRSNTAQAGAAGSITLDASASAVDDFYKNAIVVVSAGTGVNQARTISGYVGATKVASVTPNWGTNPSSDSVFVIIPMGAVAGASAPSAADVADAVWDEVLAGHAGAGSAGEALDAAGTAGDPWTTALPGAYGSGTAGKIIGDNINATISSRASQASVDTIDGIVDSILVDTGTTLQGELDGIQADTEDIQSRLPAALTGAGNIKADVLAISGDATAADNLETAADGGSFNLGGGGVVAASVTGAVGSVASGGITAASLASDTITAAKIAADAITAAKIADGAIDANTFAAGAITATAIAADAITDAKVASDVTIASVTGSVGSVTGAVGSVTGAVGSIASGGISASSFAAGAIDAAAIAADAIGSSELAATAVTEIQSGLATAASISTLQASVDTIDDFLDTEIAAIKTVTDQLAAAQSEPSAVPAANASPLAKIAWLAALARNKITQTATTQTLRNDADSATIAASTHSDDGTTHTRGEWA
jgi:hypothetical protein